MFQNMGGVGNSKNQPIQHNLDTLKNVMINKGIENFGISEVNSYWSKITIK